MLGSFDEVKVAFRDLRTVDLAGAHGRTLILRPVFLDGRLAGSWRRKLAADAVRLEFTLAAACNARQEAALAAEAERYGHHLGRPVEVAIAEGELDAAA